MRVVITDDHYACRIEIPAGTAIGGADGRSGEMKTEERSSSLFMTRLPVQKYLLITQGHRRPKFLQQKH